MQGPKVPKLKLKSDFNFLGNEAGGSGTPNLAPGLPASAKTIKRSALKLHGAPKQSQINSGRVIKNNQIQAYKPVGASSNEPPKRSSSNKVFK